MNLILKRKKTLLYYNIYIYIYIIGLHSQKINFSELISPTPDLL